MDEDTETMELLLQLKELRCARLEALISLKEARLKEAKLREARLRSLTPSPSHSPSPPLDAATGGAGEETREAPSPPPVLRRKSSSLVNVETPGPNANPLGKLQPLGRREYRPSASARFTARSPFPASGTKQPRAGLLLSGLPADLVQRWHAGSLSGDLALREILDAVCRARSGTDASPQERELSAMTQAFSADGSLALGGPLGGLVGGLPLAKLGIADASADLSPLRAVLNQPPEIVWCEALRLFTRQLLTGAEAEQGHDRHSLTLDLAKLSTEELNLAFRRACLKHHPNRKEGSLGALLVVHFHFALVSLTWASLDANSADSDAEERPGTPNAGSRRSSSSPRAAGSPSKGDAEDAKEAMDDTEVLAEVRQADVKLAEEAEDLAKTSPSALEALNERAAARAVQMTRVRNLLEIQLDSMRGVGAYSIIGCSPDVSDKHLAAAYRDAARRLHPDRGGDKASFQRLQAAYEEVTRTRKAANKGKGGDGGGEGGGRRSKRSKRKNKENARRQSGEGKGGEGSSAAKGQGSDAENEEEDNELAGEEGESPGKKAGKKAGKSRKAKAAEGETEEEAAAEAAEEEDSGKTEEAADAEPPATPDADAEEAADGAEDGEEEVASKADAEAAEGEAAAEEEEEEPLGDEATGEERKKRRERRRARRGNDGTNGEGAEEDGEVEEGEIPDVEASVAAAAAEREARAAARAAAGDDDDEEGVMMTSEEMCNVAEQAAEAARACAASSRIGKRVCDLGSGGWGVLCDCAQTVLRTCRAASMAALKVGHSAMQTPPHITASLDAATECKLEKGGERAVRGLMEAILSSVREGRDVSVKAKECTDKAGEGAQVVLSLIRLPPNPEKLTSAVGADALLHLMSRVADVLSEMASCVGEAAERAMSTAVSVEAMHRQAKLVTEMAAKAGSKDDQVMSSSESESSDDDDEDLKEAKRAAKEAEAKRREEAAAKAAKEQEEQGDPEAHLGAGAKQRLANVRMLRKLSAEVRESQEKLRQLVSAAPQLMPGVSIGQKEEIFQQLAELLAAAEQPIARRWYESTPRSAGDAPTGRREAAGWAAAAAEEAEAAADEEEAQKWVDFVCGQLEFVLHAADASELPVPSSLGARLLRQAVSANGTCPTLTQAQA